MAQAIIYMRFSSAEQKKGTSKERQAAICRDFCQQKGWTISAEIADEGKSAWSGKHRGDGELGRFEAAARAGLHSGKILVVEKLDRLSRQSPATAYEFVAALTRAGVTISTADGRHFSAGAEPDMVSLITFFVETEQAHKESEKKSERLKQRYAIDREKVRQGLKKRLSKNAPKWLAIGKEGQWELIPDRAAVVRRIFELADSGYGRMTIARILNGENFERWRGCGNGHGDGWHPSFITRILSNRAVLGEWQPYEYVEGKRVPAGEPILHHYPRVIESDLFERVNANAEARKAVRGGRKSTTIANLFSGLLTCHACGSSMVYRQKKAAGRTTTIRGRTYQMRYPYANIICSSAQRKTGCSNDKTIAYHRLEKSVLDNILHLALDDNAFVRKDDAGRLNIAITDKRRELEIHRKRAENLWFAYATAASEMAMKMAEEAENAAKKIDEELVALERDRAKATGAASSAEHLRRVADIRANLYHEDMEVRVPLRRKVAEAFQSVVTYAWCAPDGSVTVVLGGGIAAFKILDGKLIEQGNAAAMFMDGKFETLAEPKKARAVFRRINST